MINRKHSDIALVVDLDGTLIKHDMLWESFWSIASKRPLIAIKLIIHLRHGISSFKEKLAHYFEFDPSKLSYNQPVLSKIKEWRIKNGKVSLVTASDQKIANAIAEYLGLFDEVYASDKTRNLKGKLKANFLEEIYGAKNFDYIGDSIADLPAWKKARRIISYNAGPLLRKKISNVSSEIEHIVDSKPKLSRFINALRPHHWIKNILIFIPAAITAQEILPTVFLQLVYAFIAFSLVASGGYLLNDLLDLEADRAHPEKKFRSLAAGELSLIHATFLMLAIIIIAFAIAYVLVSIEFMIILAAYCLLTTSYSLYFKRKIIFDIFSLAILYTLRVITGGIVAELTLTVWLLAFSMFLFLSLATIKRLSELVASGTRSEQMEYQPYANKKFERRAYLVVDIPIMQSMSLAAGYISILILALHISTEPFQQFYSEANILWGDCVLLLFWITRLVFVTHRGQMHHDPIIFAVRDKVSLLIVVGLIALHVAAKFL